MFGSEPQCYVVRIYRRSAASPDTLVGVVADTNGRHWSFRTGEELLRALSEAHEERPSHEENA